MKPENGKFLKNAIAVIAGMIITSFLFLFLPFSHSLFQKKMQDVLSIKGGHKAALESVMMENPQRDKRLTKPDKAMEKQNLAMLNHFNLDLSVLANDDGTGGEGGIPVGGSRILEEGEADMPPIKRLTFPPAYPVHAREAGVEGFVIARLLIGEDGRVEQVNIITESPTGYDFGRAVTNALIRWKFEPARIENMPVRVWARQEVRFSL